MVTLFQLFYHKCCLLPNGKILTLLKISIIFIQIENFNLLKFIL